jgi:hypothetical protein
LQSILISFSWRKVPSRHFLNWKEVQWKKECKHISLLLLGSYNWRK